MPGRVTDNTVSAVNYTGNWTHSNDTRYFSGTKSVSNSTGAKATFTFAGTTISVWGKKLAARGGKFDLYVDGLRKQANVSTADTADEFGAKLAEVTGLTSGSHTIELRLSSPGGYIGFDYFGVK